MITGILPLLVLGAIVVLIVRAVMNRNAEAAPGESGTVSIRRFFQYVVLFGVLVVVALGLSELIEQLLPEQGRVIRRDTAEIARSLAFLIVGIPVYLGLGAWVRRGLADRRERTSLGWSFYLTVTLLTSLIVAGIAAFDLLSWAFGAESYNDASLARLIVWGAIWASHWVIAARYQEAPRGEGHLLGGSAISLTMVATSVGFALTTMLSAAYDNLFTTTIVQNFGDDLGRALAGLIVSGAAWWFYWVHTAVRLERTTLWHVYVMLLGVLGGLLTAIGAGSALLYTTLEWFIGDPGRATAAGQFEVLPGSLAVGLLGLGLFFYHRAVLGEAGVAARTEVRRVYEYVISAVGLLASATGLTILLVALMRVLAGGDAIAGASESNTVLGAVTALAIGAPIWWVAWSRIQGHRAAAAEAELRSPSRRSYLMLLFGVGGVTAVISLIVAFVTAIEDIIDGRFGSETVSDIAPAVALVLTTGAVAGYHWLVFREDRAEEPAGLRSPLREVVIVGVAGNGLAGDIRTQLDARVRVWDRLDGHSGTVDHDAVMAALAEQTDERVMLIAWEDGYRIVPVAARPT